MESGAVFWITGLAGSGKSTIAKFLKKRLEKSVAVLLLDGDDLRQVFSNAFTYSMESRFKAAQCYSRLCKLVSEQGIDVICPTISLFHEIHAWNKQNLRNYIEIYLDVPIDILVKEGKREFYQQQEIKDKHQGVAGIDFLPQPPSNPDIIINNREVTAEQAVEQILNFYFQNKESPPLAAESRAMGSPEGSNAMLPSGRRSRGFAAQAKSIQKTISAACGRVVERLKTL